MLAIRKVVLYKHGVGYFERHGEIEGDATVALHFKAAEMNDVLKSLTTVDLDGGLVSSVSYESTKPVDKQLEDIAIRLPDQNSLTALISQLKGARVAVEAGSQHVEGVITGVESMERRDATGVLKSTYVNLLIDGAALRSFDLLEVKSLTFLDEGLRKDLQHLLDILISAKKKDLKKLTVFAKGAGKRRLMASYTVETPVWKTSYRLLLDKDRPTMQGWALVDNTQDEDWDDVSLTLVAGLPVSFVHDLYSPRYKRRPVVKVQEEEAYAPPIVEHTTILSSKRAGGLPRDMDVATLSARDNDEVGAAVDMRESLRAARERSMQVQTRTVETGDLFEYRIQNPVSVKRNQSALVPILQASVEGRRVALYNAEIREKNPMSAVQLTNTTRMTLEGGPVTVMEDETYVGESMLDTMKPGEERLVPYSVELGCLVTLDDKSERRDVHFARVAGGKLHLLHYRVSSKIYVVTNKTERKLDLFLEHRFTPGWDLVETPAPVEKTEHFYRFRFEVPPKETITFAVNEKGEESEAIALHTASRDQLRIWLEGRYIDRKTRDAVDECAQIYEKAAALVKRVQERDKESTDIVQDQDRLRKNLQALGASADEKGLRERYVGELTKTEDRIALCRDESKGMRAERDKLADELRARLAEIKFEAAVPTTR